MEAFNVLKFWRNSYPNTTSGQDIISELDDLDYIRNPTIDTDEETDDGDSFFDLVFTGPEGRVKVDTNSSKYVSVNSPHHAESPRDVFYKPKSFAIDSNSKPHSPISILRTAPKFRVFFLGFKKSKAEKMDIDGTSLSKMSPKFQSKRFMTKDSVPASPVFTRDNSLRSKLQKEKEEDFAVDESLKKFVRGADVSKYLKLMKPLYAKASRRYTGKIGVSDSTASPWSSPLAQSIRSPRKGSEEKQGNRVAAFGAMRKHLGKSRSAAATFAGASPSPMNRRDDSLLEQNDGIQGAILHCKRSYSLAAKCEDLPRVSSEELNRWSI